jgi:O-antigen/teichoic acid export membrane protein
MIEKIKNKTYNFLRWSQKYTGTDNVYLAKNGFWLILNHGVQIIMSLVLLIIFTNLLSKEIYGTYQFILSVAGTLSLFTFIGTGTAVMRATAKGSESALHKGLKIKLLWNLGIVVASSITAIYYYINDNELLFIAFLIVAIFQPLISAFELYNSYLIGKQLFRKSSALTVIQRLLPFIILVPTIFLTDNLLIIIFIYFSSNAFSLFLIYKITSPKRPKPSAIDDELLNYSKHLSIIGIIAKITEYSDKILVWHFLGATSVAVYALAQMPILNLRSILRLIHSLAFPKLVKKDLSQLKKTLPKKIRYYFLIVSSSVFLYIIAAPFLFKIFFPNYPEAVIYSQFLALSVLAVPRAIIGQVFTAHKKKKEQYILNISTSVVRIILLLILLPIYGIWGAILSTLAVDLYRTILVWFLFYRIKEGY